MSLFSLANVKRLAAIWAIMAVVAIMTGASGNNSAPPTTGVHGSFMERVSFFGLFATSRWVLFLAIGVILWLFSSLYRPRARQIRKGVNIVMAAPRRLATNRSTRLMLMGVALIVVLILPKFIHESFWMYLIVEQIGVWILLALGLNVVVGFAGLLDLGFAAFYAIGAYTTAWFTGALPMPALFHHPIPTLWVIPIGIVAAMIFGVVLGTPTLRLRGDYLAIVTLGFALIIDDFVETQSGVTGGGLGTHPVPHPLLDLGFFHFKWSLSPTPYYYLCLFFIIVFLAIFSSLEHSRVGRAWVAIREDEVAAESVGINPLKYKVMAFAVGAASGGFGGVLTGGLVGIITPSLFTYQVSVNVLVLVIFGGMGSIWGVALGTIVIQIATSYLDNYQPWGYQFNDLYMYIGALLIVMMIFRPAGLLPSRRRAREFAAAEGGDATHGDEVLTGEQPMSDASTADLVFDVTNVTLRFGGVVSLRDVSLEMRRGEILAVIGPNGAGKTSLFNSLTGVYQPQEGTITFTPREGPSISVIGKKAHRISRAGVSRTFQASRLFSALTVFENVKIGAEDHKGLGLVGSLVKGPRTRHGEKVSDALVLDLLDFVDLTEEANLVASQLSYGGRRRLEIARALATKPEVILLDEPAAGTNPSEKLQLAALIRRVRDERQVGVLLIEHDMKLVMSLAERLYVLNFGSVIAEGSPQAIRENQTVIDAYLGSSREDAST